MGASVANRGRWEDSNGRRIWRTAIRVAGSTGLRLHFEDFSIGSGKVWIYPASNSSGEALASYSQNGPLSDGEFWSGTVPGDEVVIEYQPADGAGVALPFRLEEIGEQWAPLYGNPATQLQPADVSQCTLDVTCSPSWSTPALATAEITFVYADGLAQCSGTLLNTVHSSGIPYFLTAGHCVNDALTARSVEASWRYQSATCGGSAQQRLNGPLTGAIYLVGQFEDGGLDYSLLQLNSLPTDGGFAFSGWDASKYPANTSVASISHPLGYPKSIAFGAIANYSDTLYSVVYSAGAIDHGSSGSGVFPTAQFLNGVFVDAPTGQVACVTKPLVGYVTPFSAIYPNIKPFLNDPGIADVPAQILSPTPGSTLPYWKLGQNGGANGYIFITTSKTGQSYRLLIGSSVGANNYIDSGNTPYVGTSFLLTGRLPTDGSTLYVRLITTFASGPQFVDYTYTASTGPAQLTNGNGYFWRDYQNQILSWNAVKGAIGYQVLITSGGKTYFDSGETTNLSLPEPVSLPQGVFQVNLRTHLPFFWLDADPPTYACGGTCEGLGAYLFTPVPPDKIAPGTKFAWTPQVPFSNGSGAAKAYHLDISDNIWQQHGNIASLTLPGNVTEAVVPGLPNDGRRLYVVFYAEYLNGGTSTVNSPTEYLLYYASNPIAPIINFRGVVSNLSGKTTIAPNSWVSIYGANFLPGQTALDWGAFIIGKQLPTSLVGVNVTVDGKPAAIGYLSDGLINILPPDDKATGSVPVVVTTSNGVSDPVFVNLQPAAPAMASINNKYSIALIFPDNTLAIPPGTLPGTTTRAAKPGEFLTIYGTGFGATNPSVTSGFLLDSPLPTASPVTATIGGVSANVSYSGLIAPGLNQINLTVPAVASGDQPIILTVNGVSTPTLLIAIGQ
jgi:uncharacterized protein (TIGR03437 family)